LLVLVTEALTFTDALIIIIELIFMKVVYFFSQVLNIPQTNMQNLLGIIIYQTYSYGVFEIKYHAISLYHNLTYNLKDLNAKKNS
jgi:hypothetical protein